MGEVNIYQYQKPIKMKKDFIIEELREKAKEDVRDKKKSKQLLFVAISVFVLLIFSWFLYCFFPGINSIKSFMPAVFLCSLGLIILSGVILSFGKISEEKVDKAFKDLLSRRKKNREEELRLANKRIDELREEIEILEEI